ncbi:hypothetical protein DESA109040_02435 [Deinococcus saxicola]|uniref:hypothetical protein n=1 Tax=Deinococcus saxicola TaxID=249406 RepID=UPI0039EE7AB5
MSTTLMLLLAAALAALLPAQNTPAPHPARVPLGTPRPRQAGHAPRRITTGPSRPRRLPRPHGWTGALH